MNRAEAARSLGLTRSRLAALEREGVAQPGRDDRRVPQYAEAEVERLRRVIGTLPTKTRKGPSRRPEDAVAPGPSTVPRPLVVGSERTLELLDAAEQVETETRLAEAERKLAGLRGQERELDDLRARDAARSAADVAEHHRQLWRHSRIAEVLAIQEINLIALGYDQTTIAWAMAVAGAVLNAEMDSVLSGAIYPAYLAARLISDVLRLEPPPLPSVLVTMPAEGRLIQTWRPVVPGD